MNDNDDLIKSAGEKYMDDITNNPIGWLIDLIFFPIKWIYNKVKK